MSIATGDSHQRVLAAIRDAGAATVSELADTTGLSRPTVESALGRLERELLVHTDASAQSRGSGRPARVSTFRASAGAVAGLDLTGERAQVVVTDLAGGLLATSASDTASPTQGRSDVQPVVELLDRTLLSAGLGRGDLRAIGIGIPGLVRADGVLELAPEVQDWRGRNMRELFTETFGVPAVVDNDLSLAATAEARGGALTDTQVGVYALSWFHVSARTVIDGTVLRGRRSGAGEVGLLSALSDVQGPTGTLRSSMPAVVESLTRLRSNGEDREGIETLERLTTAMAPSIAALVLATDPDRVVLGGELSVFHDMIAPRLTAAIRDAVAIDVDVEVVPGALGEHAVALGALHHAFSQLPHEIYGTATMTPPSLPTVHALRDAKPTGREQFSAAVIGVGARAGLARNVESFGGAIIAAVDPDPSTATVAADLFGADIPLLPDVATLLREFPDLDGAIVASPDDTHADIAVDLLEAGVPVYLEKPLAITTEDCDRVLEAAHRTGTKLYVGHNMRHMHVVRLMKEIIDRGEIGEVKAIWCRHFVGTGGDFYFKDWHADRSRAGSLLLQKGAHDIDVMHWLAGSASRDVVGMGDLAVYGQVTDRRDNSDRRMRDWFSSENWPPLTQTELNPVVDVEDISMILARLDSGAFISYQQCHFTPDYWRNYTVIGTEGRLENFGDGEGGEVRVWNKRSGFLERGHVQYPIVGDANGHGDADQLTVGEFIEFVRAGSPTDTSPLSARDSVAAGVAGAESLRSGSKPVHVAEVGADVRSYFENNQERP